MCAGLHADGHLGEINLRAKSCAVMIGMTLRGLAHHHVEGEAAARDLAYGAETSRVGGVDGIHAKAAAQVRVKVVAIVKA